MNIKKFPKVFAVVSILSVKTTSNNYLTLVTAKRVPADRGHISIKVCDINNFSYIKEVYFQVYGLESSAANNVTFVN